ncbi:VOC family protein [Bacillus bingmayongensis]|nr:hypothetical protein [Bacillus sp. XF8]MBY0598259.1 VOC family protein [Bacillus bingmayongensis]
MGDEENPLIKVSLYEEGLGLKRIGEFHNHEGYDGVMFGLPDAEYHLEFTRAYKRQSMFSSNTTVRIRIQEKLNYLSLKEYREQVV